MADLIGWVATVTVVFSYFTRQATTLRRIQGFGACLWGVYGAMIHSWPVVVANIIVASAALATSFRKPAPERAATGKAL